MQLTIIGAGAIGGTIGAHMIRAGHDVLFCDADAAHVEAINQRGLDDLRARRELHRAGQGRAAGRPSRSAAARGGGREEPPHRCSGGAAARALAPRTATLSAFRTA